MSYIISVESLPMEEHVYDTYEEAAILDNLERAVEDYCPDPDDDIEWPEDTVYLNIEIICADGLDFPVVIENLMIRVDRVIHTDICNGDTYRYIQASEEE